MVRCANYCPTLRPRGTETSCCLTHLKTMVTGGRFKAVREPARARQEHLFVRVHGVWVYNVSVGAQIFSMVSVGAQILPIRPLQSKCTRFYAQAMHSI